MLPSDVLEDVFQGHGAVHSGSDGGRTDKCIQAKNLIQGLFPCNQTDMNQIVSGIFKGW